WGYVSCSPLPPLGGEPSHHHRESWHWRRTEAQSAFRLPGNQARSTRGIPATSSRPTSRDLLRGGQPPRCSRSPCRCRRPSPSRQVPPALLLLELSSPSETSLPSECVMQITYPDGGLRLRRCVPSLLTARATSLAILRRRQVGHSPKCSAEPRFRFESTRMGYRADRHLRLSVQKHLCVSDPKLTQLPGDAAVTNGAIQTPPRHTA